MEPFAQAVFQEIKKANGEIRAAIGGLSSQALNWRPASKETNSLYVLATHVVGTERSWAALAAGKKVERDRAAEFAAKGDDAAALATALDRAEAEVEEWLASMTQETLPQPRTTPTGPMNAAGCLTWTLLHLGEHVGHATLTRQLWDQAASKGE
ncbi:MAG: DUF664 domain-containing protein [Chloroflexi bacterium]|nr:DUF664 domain-containing protein [Chloroflexota bacterium]